MSLDRFLRESIGEVSIFRDTMVEMTWQEVQQACDAKSIVLLPIGMIEEHGPHMDLSPDIYMAYHFCRSLRYCLVQKGVPTLIAPPFYWGISDGVAKYPGTFSVRPETMKALLKDIFTSLDSWGVQYLFINNAHGDQVHCRMIKEAIEESKGLLTMEINELTDFIVEIDEPPVFPKQREDRFQPDYHAGAIETAAVHTFFPQKVKVDQARILQPQKTFEPLGYCGDPASFEKETTILEYWKADVETDALKILKFINL